MILQIKSNSTTRGLVTVAILALVPFLSPATAGEHSANSVRAAAERMFSTMPKDYYTIKVVQAEKEMATGVPVVVDVRETKEFAEEHIQGAINIPLGSLVKQMEALPSDKARPILVYCKSGHRGAMALSVLRMIGYENVRSMYGGIVGWKNAGFPVKQ